MKICFVCNQAKPLSDYYAHKRMADGHLNKCKECTKRQVHERRMRLEQDPKWMAKEAARHREKSNAYRESGRHKPDKTRVSQAAKEWRARNQGKRAAHMAVQYALRRGDMIRGACEVCGDAKTHGHHDDYSQPLSVRWLCAKHHGAEHIKR